MSLANIADGLRMYLRMEETSGSRIDAWGYSDLPDPAGNVGNTTGKIGTNAVLFESANTEYLTRDRAPENSVFDFGNDDFTIAGWVKLTTLADGAIWSTIQLISAQNGFHLQYQSSTNRLRWICYGDGTTGAIAVANDFGNLTADVWVFVVCQHDETANKVGISVDNSAIDLQNLIGGVFQGTAPLMLGCYLSTLNIPEFPINAAIDEFMIWDRLLTAAEITSLHNSGSGVNLQTTLAAESAPTAPSSLSIGTAKATELTLSFTDNSDNEASFEIQRKSTGSFVKVWDAPCSSGTGAVTFRDTGLASGVKYTYRVRAINPTGASAFATVASGTTTTELAGITTGLVVHHTLNEESGKRFDSWTKDVDLSDINTVLAGQGKHGKAALFVRANSEELKGPSKPNFSASFSFALWTWLITYQQMSLLSKYQLFGNQCSYVLQYFLSSNRYRWVISDDGITPQVLLKADAAGQPALGIWTWVYVEYDADANVAKIEINDTSEDTDAHSTGVFQSTAPYRIGAEGSSSEGQADNFFNGMLDHAIGWNRVLTDAEKTAIYNAGVGVDLSGEIAANLSVDSGALQYYYKRRAR